MNVQTFADAPTARQQDEVLPEEGRRRLVAESYDLLYRLHARPLFRYLLRLSTGNHRDAEDYCQETFLRAWRWLQDHPTDPEIMRPWLYTVAKRIVVDGVRAKQARPTEVAANDLNLLSQPDSDIERLVQMHALRTALMSLSEEHRAALIEIFYCEHTAKEAAEILGVPEGTVKSRAYYAIRALRARAVAGYLEGFGRRLFEPGVADRRAGHRAPGARGQGPTEGDAGAPAPVGRFPDRPAGAGLHLKGHSV